MKELSRNNLRSGANIALVVLLVSISGQLFSYFQAKQQLISPLFPQNTLLTVTEPFVFAASVSSLACIVALVFYFYSKYLMTIITCCLALICQQFFPYYW